VRQTFIEVLTIVTETPRKDVEMPAHRRLAWSIGLLLLGVSYSLAEEGLWERLNAQAMDLHRQKRDQEALPIAQQALAAAETQSGPGGSKLATSLTNLGEICRTLSRYGEAEQLYRRGLSIVERKPGLETIEAAKLLDNLGALCEAWGKYAQAASFTGRP
jgi:hypothetical protein